MRAVAFSAPTMKALDKACISESPAARQSINHACCHVQLDLLRRTIFTEPLINLSAVSFDFDSAIKWVVREQCRANLRLAADALHAHTARIPDHCAMGRHYSGDRSAHVQKETGFHCRRLSNIDLDHLDVDCCSLVVNDERSGRRMLIQGRVVRAKVLSATSAERLACLAESVAAAMESFISRNCL